MRILITPERLVDLSRQFSQAAAELQQLDQRLGRALNALEWQVRQTANIEARVNAARRLAQNCADDAERIARFLNQRAQAFQQADQQSAQGLGTTTSSFLAALRSSLPQAYPLLLAYMTAGRVNAQKFLDVWGIHRYGPLAPWLKVGVLDQRYKVSRLVKGVGAGVGVGLGIAVDVLTAERIDEETISVAVIRNVGEHALGAAVPVVGGVLIGNAAVQLVGAGVVAGSRAVTPALATSQAMAEDLNTSSERLEAAFKRVDLGRITKDISEIVYDVTFAPRFEAIKAAWQEPNLKNLGWAFAVLNPMTPVLTPASAQETWQDVKKLGLDVFDFVQGIPDLNQLAFSHTATFGLATVSKVFSALPVPGEQKDQVNQFSEYLIDWVISNPGAIKSAWQTMGNIIPGFYPMGSASGLSWANSIQFTPVVTG